MNPKDIDFPKLVRVMRKGQGINQTQLADLLSNLGNNWTQRIVSRIEQGQEPTLTQAMELDSVLRLGLFDLTDGYEQGYRAGIDAARKALEEL